MDVLLAEYEELSRRHTATTSAQLDSVDLLIARARAGEDVAGDVRALQADLVSGHKTVGSALNRLGRGIDAAAETKIGELCAPSVRLAACKINDAVCAHLFREGMFGLGRVFAREAGVTVDERGVIPFQELWVLLEAFRLGQLAPAIDWCCEKGASGLEFRLHRLAYLQMLQIGRRDVALEYAKTHFKKFPDQIVGVQKLMACLLYASALEKSPYKDLVSVSHRYDIERALIREYCRVNGLPKDSSLVTVVRCGTKAIPTLLKASRVKVSWRELGLDDALPSEIDIGRECRFHSIFTCAVSKEESTEGTNIPMILPCGHVLSKQSILRLPRGTPRFKCPYCPMEQAQSECHEVRF